MGLFWACLGHSRSGQIHSKEQRGYVTHHFLLDETMNLLQADIIGSGYWEL
jgi:hypothetical protein